MPPLRFRFEGITDWVIRLFLLKTQSVILCRICFSRKDFVDNFTRSRWGFDLRSLRKNAEAKAGTEESWKKNETAHRDHRTEK